MKRHQVIATAALICVSGLFAVPSEARAIRVDSGNWSCSDVNLSGTWVTMTAGSGSLAASATLEPGLSTYATGLCTPAFPGLNDFNTSAGPFIINQTGTSIYQWADDVQVADYTLDPSSAFNQAGNDNGLGNPNSVNYGGDSEIQFNYLAGDDSTCLLSAALPYEPEFVLGGTTYRDTQTSPAQLCSANSTSDMLFNGTTLVGYIDQFGNVQNGLAPGWEVVAPGSVSEPDTLAMLLLGMALVGLTYRRRPAIHS